MELKEHLSDSSSTSRHASSYYSPPQALGRHLILILRSEKPIKQIRLEKNEIDILKKRLSETGTKEDMNMSRRKRCAMVFDTFCKKDSVGTVYNRSFDQFHLNDAKLISTTEEYKASTLKP